jgi:hypothetical protein
MRMNWFPRFLLIILLPTLFACGSSGDGEMGTGDNSVTITWDPPTYAGYGDNTSITAYIIHYGEDPDNLDNTFEVTSTETSFTLNYDDALSGLETKIYVAVSAVNNNNLESTISNVISN